MVQHECDTMTVQPSRQTGGDDLTDRYGDGVADRLAQYDSGEYILDLGCGGTTGVPALADPSTAVVQVDNNPGATARVRQQRASYREQCGEQLAGSCLLADAGRLPFADNTFDVVFAGALFRTHTWSERHTLTYGETDVDRVLADGGDLLVANGRYRSCEMPEAALALHDMDELYMEEQFDSYELTGPLLVLEGYRQ